MKSVKMNLSGDEMEIILEGLGALKEVKEKAKEYITKDNTLGPHVIAMFNADLRLIDDLSKYVKKGLTQTPNNHFVEP